MKRFRRRRINHNDGGNTAAGQLLSLSMFIMLLAFFIVLNSVSSFDESKVSPVLGSLDLTFSNQNKINRNKPSVTAGMNSRGEGETRFLTQVERLFRGHISGIEVQKNERTGVMHIRTSYEELDSALSQLGQEQRADDPDDIFLLPTLVSLLKTGQSGIPYRMDIMLNIAQPPSELYLNYPDDFTTARNNIGKFARTLERAGLTSKQISIGLSKGNPNDVDLFFHPVRRLNILEDSASSSSASTGAL